MGALLSCISDAEEAKNPSRSTHQQRRRHAVNPPPAPLPPIEALGIGSSGRWSKSRSGRKEEALTDEQALAAAAMLLQHSRRATAGGVPADGTFDRSTSLRYPGHGPKKQGGGALPRSSSTRARSLTDPVLQPQQLVNQDVKFENLETDHFVLVHGGGFGAWCWYKTIALLEDSGFKVNAIDLSGSGISSCDANKITSLSEYANPLTSFLETLENGEKVIIVGHDFGGSCISYAMEMFPVKIAKAVFLCAAMLKEGQNTIDIFSKEAGANDPMQQAQIFVYANGKDHPPTAIDLDKSLVKDLLFNQSPSKDVALALVSMRSIPFPPVLEKLLLTDKNYSSVRRFYIETTEDGAIPLPLQQSMCTANPPEKVFRLKGSDHSPFFSKPQALHKLLVEIAKIPML